MSRTLYVLFTMDVEPIKLNPLWTGPENAELSELYTKTYWDMCTKHGFTPSFMIHPETARLHSTLFTEYMKQGAALGLHVHSTKFHYPEYRYEFGYYSAAMQKEIVHLALQEWEAAMNIRPLYFRPGAFSANDATAAVLKNLGFRGGSLSIPGRIWPERYCVWSGVPRYPHRAHAAFRCAHGNLDFIDIPLSVDFSRPSSSNSYFCYEDLRPSGRRSAPLDLLQNIIKQIKQDDPAIPVLQIITHNDQPFDDPASESCKRLNAVLKSIEQVSATFGFVPQSSTIEKITDMTLALPIESSDAWDQDNDVYF